MYRQSLLNPNDTRFRFAYIMMWITLAYGVVALISDIAEYQLIVRIMNFDFTAIMQADANDNRQAVIMILFAIITIINAVAFIMWFRRAYTNLEIKQREIVEFPLRHSNGWAAGAWFVPFLNLVRPFQIMVDLHKGTLAYIKKYRPSANFNYRNGLLIGWWLTWLGGNISANLSNNIQRRSEGGSGMLTGSMVGIIGDLLFIVACLLLLKILFDFKKVEKTYHEIDAEQRNRPAPPPVPGARVDVQAGADPFPAEPSGDKPLFPEES